MTAFNNLSMEMLQEVVVKCVEYMRKRESGPDRPNRAAIQVDGNKVD